MNEIYILDFDGSPSKWFEARFFISYEKATSYLTKKLNEELLKDYDLLNRETYDFNSIEINSLLYGTLLEQVTLHRKSDCIVDLEEHHEWPPCQLWISICRTYLEE